MKRSAALPERDRPGKRTKIGRFVEQNELSQLPVELFVEIFANILDDLGLKRILRDPMKNYYPVSKLWYTQLKSTEFQNCLSNHPRYALLDLKRNFDISSPFRVHLMHTAAPLIDINAAIKLLFNAQSGEEIKELCRLPAFQFGMSLNALNMHLRYAKRRGYLFEIMPYDEDDLFDYSPRMAIKRNLKCLDLDINQHFADDKKSALDLVKLMILEDLYKPDNFTKAYKLASEIIYSSYCSGRIYAPNYLVDTLRGLVLPLSGLEALIVTTMKYLFKAAFIGDRDFSRFVNPNFSTDEEYLEDVAARILPILHLFHAGEIDEYPAKDILLAKKIIKRKTGHSLRIFERNLIEKRKQQILDDVTINDAIKQLVRLHI